MKSFFPLVIPAFLLLFSSSGQSQSLASVHAWAYQLDAIHPEEIAGNTTFDLIVMDYSADGTPEKAFTAAQISAIQRSGKIALAYLSIGEAEDYRFYWKPVWKIHPPNWLGPENPNWPGNYKVRFWDPNWQRIVFAYVDTILARGFDGIYCDIIDAYYYWREENPEQPLADSLMVRFLAKIRQHVESKTSAPFFIFPQNGEALIEEDHITDSLRALFWNSIDGIGVEDVFCPGDADENNPFAPDSDRLNYLQKFRAHGKIVLSVEYLTDTHLIARYIRAASAAHFIPYAAPRALNRLVNGIPTEVRTVFRSAPEQLTLSPNFPNPFNPTTAFRFFLTAPTPADFAIYSATGRRVWHYRWQNLRAGLHTIFWNAKNLPSGAYFYRLSTPRNAASGKALLLK